jgi:hypothetical protein
MFFGSEPKIRDEKKSPKMVVFPKETTGFLLFFFVAMGLKQKQKK